MSRAFTVHRRPALGGRSLASGAVLTVAFVMVAAACGGGGSKFSPPWLPSVGAATNQGSGRGQHDRNGAEDGQRQIRPDPDRRQRLCPLHLHGGQAGRAWMYRPRLTLWPPLLLPAGVTHPVAGPGVSGLGTFARPEGTEVTYQGLPLYTYQPDTQPGLVTGQGVVDSGGTWILATIGSMAAPASNAASASANPTTAQPTVTTPPSTQPPVTVGPSATPPATHAVATNPPATRPPTTGPARPDARTHRPAHDAQEGASDNRSRGRTELLSVHRPATRCGLRPQRTAVVGPPAEDGLSIQGRRGARTRRLCN